MLRFNPKTGVSVDDVSTVRERVRQAFIDAFKKNGAGELNTEPETPAGQLIDSITASIVQKDSEILYLANQFNPLTSSGIWQDALGQIYFLDRKAAVNSTAVCTCTGRAGTVISAGSQIASSLDDTRWSNTEDAVIGSDGTVDVTFTCTTAGAVSASADTLTQIITVVPGWDSVTNAAQAVVEQNIEGQGAFESRRYASVALNSRSTEEAVYARVSALDNVLAVYFAQNRGSTDKVIDTVTLTPHSAYVCVLGGDDNEIAQAIYQSLSAGCDTVGNTTISITDENSGAISEINFDRPAEQAVAVQVTIRKNALTTSDADQKIKEAVYNNFYGLVDLTIAGEPVLRAKMGDDIYSSRFYVSVLNCGITEILSIKISASNSDLNWLDVIHVPINQNPTLSLDDIDVVIEEALS